MPTPLEILLDPVSLIVIAMYGTLMLWEAIFPGRKLEKIKGWKFRGIIAFVIYFFLSTYLPLFISPWLEPHKLFDLSGIGTIPGAILGVLLYEFGVFAWHYCMHRYNFLWRSFHQMHHSAERIDTYGAFYFSPLDMIGWTVLATICFSLIAGFSPKAISLILLSSTFLTIFQHCNIKTPRWLGYIVQRPESHTYHHARQIHQGNYSDLPLFDILFGTFHNPKNFEYETGFYTGASARVGEMILFKDVTKPKAESKSFSYSHVKEEIPA